MKVPEEIMVVRNGRTAEVEIDGEEFPYAIARGETTVKVHPDEAPSVTLTLLAKRVRVLDELDSRDRAEV